MSSYIIAGTCDNKDTADVIKNLPLIIVYIVRTNSE